MSWWGAGPISYENICYGVMIRNLTQVEADSMFLEGTWKEYSGLYGFWVNGYIWGVLINNGFLEEE